MSLLSFEKYLREIEDVHICAGQGRSVSVRVGGSGRGSVVWAEWEDDCLFSITGRALFSLRELYPGGDVLPSSPLVQTARGVDVDGVLTNFDIPGIVQFLRDAHEHYATDDWSAIYIYHGALVEGRVPTAAEKFAAVNELHELAVRARTTPQTISVAQPLPFARPEDLMGVLCGTVRASVQSPPGGRLPKVLIDSFMEMYPDAKAEGDCLVLCGQVEISFLDAAGLPAHDLVFGPKPVARAVEAAPPNIAAPRPPMEQPLPRAPEEQQGACGGRDPGVQAGIRHVEEWYEVDPNNLDVVEREIYMYGFRGARKYIDKLSPGAKKRLFKYLEPGVHRAEAVIYELARALHRELGQASRRDLSVAQLNEMAGSRLLSQIGNWDICDTGEWTRKR